MSKIEKTGSFYLGKRYDPQKRKVLAEPVLYESRDLTTHAVCVGMTGSGKTGLCIDLLEEAALQGIPAIVVDPKGDMTNLLLTFPGLRPAEFRPWINLDDARRKGLSPDEYAQEIASTWARGLREWGIGLERLQRLRDAAEFAIYTPGSDAGQPISILHTLKVPALSWDENEELLREKIAGTVSALLALIGIEADPVKSREHILLANIFEEAWRKGEDLDIARLILRIQKPPLAKLGVFPVETFFPEKDRLELAMALNGLIATPSFENWIEGQALDIDAILHTPEGKPRVSIFYIAHLDEAERMFFMTLLLGQVQTWLRAQSGTTGLRAILYCDEVFGYLPTHPANPPSKPPLLYLLKQARAFGLGLVLTTQNPVDLDYKALSNAGTWLIG
ncbi:MAG TPA: ATP-binding protein, partial [Anaerolineae bacterium]|nr:ATP-binding protein [Anaerolineae bacterium]